MEDLSHMVNEMTDGQLLEYRVKLVRQMGRISGFLGIVDSERAARTPEDSEAVILRFPLVEAGV